MNYDTIIDLDRITLEDCVDMYNRKHLIAIIDGGKIINFKKEEV